MKRKFVPGILVLGAIMLSSGICSKKDLAPQVTSEYYPQYWIMTIDESALRYTYLRTNGATMYRSNVDKTYSLTQLAIDQDCEFEVAQSKSEYGNKDCYTLRLDKNKRFWIGVAQSPNKQEWHLITGNLSGTDPGDGYKFFIHRLPEVNGVKTVAIESVEKPGWYISSQQPGFNYAANQVTLQQVSSPDKATAWQCR